MFPGFDLTAERAARWFEALHSSFVFPTDVTDFDLAPTPASTDHSDPAPGLNAAGGPAPDGVAPIDLAQPAAPHDSDGSTATPWTGSAASSSTPSSQASQLTHFLISD